MFVEYFELIEPSTYLRNKITAEEYFKLPYNEKIRYRKSNNLPAY